jgi:glycosyltransferase involved in cell wall biosynthesis
MPADLHFCVLIPVYNNPEGLLRSLRSINYPRENHLVVVVDDGSREPITTQMLEAARLPSSFQLIRLPQNRGITEALNTGLRWIQEHTRAGYIARLDCSDTCHPERFHRQVAFLDAHPEVGLLGTWCTFRGKDKTGSYGYTTPIQHEALIKEMYSRNVFIHPTVMFRTRLLEQVGVYPYDFPHAEDYAFFWALLSVAKGAILDRFLVICELNPSGISMGNRREQLESRLRVVKHFGRDRKRQVLSFFKIKLLLFIPQSVILWYKRVRHKN